MQRFNSNNFFSKGKVRIDKKKKVECVAETGAPKWNYRIHFEFIDENRNP